MTTSPLRLFSDRAASTLAGGISPTSLTLNLTAGGGALFPNPAAPNFFAATLIDAATGLLDEIVWCTARTTDTLTVIRAQEGTNALTFNAGDLFQKLLTSGDMEAMLQSDQLFVPATTFFVNQTTGLDSNTGTAATTTAGTNIGPFKTISGAIAVIGQFFSVNGVTINVAAGPYNSFFIGSSLIAFWDIIGAGPTTTNVTGVNGDPNNGIASTISGASAASMQGLEFIGSQGGVICEDGSSLSLGSNNFGACGGNGCITSTRGSTIEMLGLTAGATAAFTFAGASPIILGVNNGGFIQLGFAVPGGGGSQLAQLIFSGVTVSATASVSSGGTLIFIPAEVSFSGAPTGPRFQLGNGTIATQGSGLSYIPGTTAGVFLAGLNTSGAATTNAQGVYS